MSAFETERLLAPNGLSKGTITNRSDQVSGRVDHLVRKGSARFLRPSGSHGSLQLPYWLAMVLLVPNHIPRPTYLGCFAALYELERLCPDFLSESPAGVTLNVKKLPLIVIENVC